ncbi:MAG: hypothetical protein DSY42_05285 [Aquifex sp.]|nr:MAG: hypothetical protein DSY42_05285 [Aquifex sp.]
MNLAPVILDRFKGENIPAEVLLIAGTPPVLRKGKSFEKLVERSITPEDIRETLAALRQHVAGKVKLEPEKGLFSFGLSGVGRVRVIYFTQRGSLVIFVAKTPFSPPHLEEIIGEEEKIKELECCINEKKLIKVVAPSNTVYTLFTMSFLNYIGNKYQRVIYTLERPLSYLLKHSQSIFIQREVGIDLSDLDEGMREAVMVEPDLVYINDIYYSTREIIEFIRHFYPYPFTVIFGSVGFSFEEVLNFIIAHRDGFVVELVDEVWLITEKEYKYFVEIKRELKKEQPQV